MIRLLSVIVVCVLSTTHSTNASNMLRRTHLLSEGIGAASFGKATIESAFGRLSTSQPSNPNPTILFDVPEDNHQLSAGSQIITRSPQTDLTPQPPVKANVLKLSTPSTLTQHNPFQDMDLFNDPEALSDFISSFTGLSVDKVIETASWVPASNPHNQHFHLVKIKTPQGERFIQVNFTIHDYWGHFGWGNPINHIMMPVNIIEGLPTDAINFIRRNYVEGVSHQFNALSRTLTFAPSLPQQPLLEKVHQVALSQASPDNIKRAPKAQQTWLEKALSWDQSTPWTFQKANMSAASALVGMCHEQGYPMSTIGQMTGLSPASIQLLIKEISDK